MIYASEPFEVDQLTEQQAKEQLKEIIAKLNELSSDDFFGTEGWEHFFGFED